MNIPGGDDPHDPASFSYPEELQRESDERPIHWFRVALAAVVLVVVVLIVAGSVG